MHASDPKSEYILVREYGCCLCQQYHREGEALFDAHILHQSKHGIAERAEHVETALRLAARIPLVKE